MKTPIDMMMAGVKWVALPTNHSHVDNNLPYATHEGILNVGEFDFHVYQLSNGKRVIEESDVRKFFEQESK